MNWNICISHNRFIYTFFKNQTWSSNIKMPCCINYSIWFIVGYHSTATAAKLCFQNISVKVLNREFVCSAKYVFLTSWHFHTHNVYIQVRILLNTSDIRRLDIMTVIVEMPGDDGMGMNETPNITSAIDITWWSSHCWYMTCLIDQLWRLVFIIIAVINNFSRRISECLYNRSSRGKSLQSNLQTLQTLLV